MESVKLGHSCPIVCLDAGHYGDYNRSPVVPAYYESHMAWKLHMLLKAQLEKYGIQVVTTRDDPNTDLSLSKRGAQAEGADLFLSLHSNACDTEYVDRPVGIYYVDDNCSKIDEQSKEVAVLLSDVVAEVMQTNDAAKTYCRQSTNNPKEDYYTVLYAAHKAGTTGIILEHSFHTNARAAAWLLEEGNLQKLAEAEAAALAEYFGVDKPKRESAPSTAADAPRMWEFLTKSCGLSDVAAAGAIANWDAECALKSTNLENRGNNALKMTDEEYTEAVDNGTYAAFCTDRYGYGLCQWTHPERKTEMIDYIHGRGMSIGNSYGQMDFFWKEIRGYKKLMDILATTTSVQEASDTIMTMYEKPGDQSKEAKKRRSDKALEYYNRFAEAKDMKENTQPVPGTPFEDVPEEAYYADAVKWAHEKGITVGRDATHFDPDSPITRAEMVTMLYRFAEGAK